MQTDDCEKELAGIRAKLRKLLISGLNMATLLTLSDYFRNAGASNRNLRPVAG